MRIWDISRPLTGDLAPWPGDAPFRYQLNARLAEGSSVNLGAIGMSVHNGTHADAPFHFQDDGATIDGMPLENYFGPAVVVDLSKKFANGRGAIRQADLEQAKSEIVQSRRLLLKTDCFPDSQKFPEWIPVLEPGAIAWLAGLRLRLAGFDVPSVDPLDDKKLANHQALAAAGIVIIESLDLRAVASGVYEFAAVPLRIAGADGSPVRAMLWRA